MSDYQLRYWNQLKELKTHIIYLDKYVVRSDRWDKTINILLAVTSSSSIAAWAVWQKYQIIWAILIALSQLVNAIKPFLPFKARVSGMIELNDNIQKISLNCENGWYSVAEGELTDKEIHELCIKFRNDTLLAEKKCLKSMILPKNNNLLKEAEIEADFFLKENYF